MQPVINDQISTLKESATLFINQRAIKLRSEGQNICHLGFGESPFPVPEPMQIALSGNAHRGASMILITNFLVNVCFWFERFLLV